MVGRIVSDDRLEERVRSYGTRWRDAHPFTSDVDTSRLRRRSRSKAIAAIVAVAVVVTIAVGVAVVARHAGPSKASPVAPSASISTSTTGDTTTTGPASIAAIPSPVAPADQTQVPLDPTGVSVAFGSGRIWVGTAAGLAVFDPVTMHSIGTVATAQTVLAVASSDNATWIVTGSSQNLETSKNPAYQLERIEPSALRVAFSTQLPFVPGYRSAEHLRLVAAGQTAWVSLADSLVRIDEQGDRVTRIALGGYGAGNIAADLTGLWIASNGSYRASAKYTPVLHVDIATNTLTAIPGFPSGFYWSVATTDGAAWTLAAVDSGTSLTLTRIDAVTHALTTHRIPGIALVTGDGQLWVQLIPPTGGPSLNYNDLIGQIDTTTGKIRRTIKIAIGEEPGSSGDGYASPPFAVGGGRIWSGYNGLQRTTP
jgi:hypothetical protein